MKEGGIDYNSIFCQTMRQYSALNDKHPCLFVCLLAFVIVVLITFSLLESRC